MERRISGPPLENSTKTHCPKGHPLSGDNLDGYHLRHGKRSCKVCCRARWRAYYFRTHEVRLQKMREWKAANL